MEALKYLFCPKRNNWKGKLMDRGQWNNRVVVNVLIRPIALRLVELLSLRDRYIPISLPSTRSVTQEFGGGGGGSCTREKSSFDAQNQNWKTKNDPDLFQLNAATSRQRLRGRSGCRHPSSTSSSARFSPGTSRGDGTKPRRAPRTGCDCIVEKEKKTNTKDFYCDIAFVVIIHNWNRGGKWRRGGRESTYKLIINRRT